MLIDRAEDLAAAAAEIREAAVVAIDTESDSLYRYRERVCFLQIGVDQQAWLVDTLALKDLDPLRPILEGPQLKVLHGADYDLSCLFRDFNVRFSNVFDTMIAAQLLGREHLGLAALVREFFGIEIDKALTRHDWGMRPLEARHLRYLVEDVVHLTGVLEHLTAELDAQDLREEASIEFERLLASIGPKTPFDPEGFRSIRGAHLLSRESLSILRELYLLRDRLAERADKPPFKVFGNHQLLEMATGAPRDFDGLRRTSGFPEHLVRRFGQHPAGRGRRRHPEPVRRPAAPAIEGNAADRTAARVGRHPEGLAARGFREGPAHDHGDPPEPSAAPPQRAPSHHSRAARRDPVLRAPPPRPLRRADPRRHRRVDRAARERIGPAGPPRYRHGQPMTSRRIFFTTVTTETHGERWPRPGPAPLIMLLLRVPLSVFTVCSVVNTAHRTS